MKKLLAVILSVCLLAGATFAFTACESGDSRETLTVYTNAAFAPWEYMNEYGEIAGVDIDIANELGDILGYKVVVRDVSFGSIFTNVQNDEMAIGAAGITITPERMESGLFSIEYATSTQYAIIPDSMDIAENKTADGKLLMSALEGKKIGTQESTTGNILITDAINGTEDEDTGEHIAGELEGTGASVIEYKNGIIAGQNLGGQIDVIVIDQLPAQSIGGDMDGYVVVELDAEPESYGIYMNKNATELKEKIDAALEVMIENGVIDYLVLKHSGAII